MAPSDCRVHPEAGPRRRPPGLFKGRSVQGRGGSAFRADGARDASAWPSTRVEGEPLPRRAGVSRGRERPREKQRRSSRGRRRRRRLGEGSTEALLAASPASMAPVRPSLFQGFPVVPPGAPRSHSVPHAPSPPTRPAPAPGGWTT